MANSLNSILIEGRVLTEITMRTTEHDSTVVNFEIISGRNFNREGVTEIETSTFAIEAWGKIAVNFASAAHTGRECRVVGRLKQDKTKDADGKEISTIKVIAEHIEWKPSKKEAV